MMERYAIGSSLSVVDEIRDAYNEAVASVAALATGIKSVCRDSRIWTVTEATRRINQMKEDGYDKEAIKENTGDLVTALRAEYEKDIGPQIVEKAKVKYDEELRRRLPSRETGVRGLYKHLERAGFDMDAVQTSWSQHLGTADVDSLQALVSNMHKEDKAVREIPETGNSGVQAQFESDFGSDNI